MLLVVNAYLVDIAIFSGNTLNLKEWYSCGKGNYRIKLILVRVLFGKTPTVGLIIFKDIKFRRFSKFCFK